MKTLSLSVLVILTAAPAALAADPPSYSKQVRPFLTRYCSECHNAKEPQGGLNLESYASLMEGGQHGPVLVAGKADDSRIVGQVEGKRKPTMPPKKASRRPTPEEAVVLRAWVDAGARDDGGSTVIAISRHQAADARRRPGRRPGVPARRQIIGRRGLARGIADRPDRRRCRRQAARTGRRRDGVGVQPRRRRAGRRRRFAWRRRRGAHLPRRCRRPSRRPAGQDHRRPQGRYSRSPIQPRRQDAGDVQLQPGHQALGRGNRATHPRTQGPQRRRLRRRLQPGRDAARQRFGRPGGEGLAGRRRQAPLHPQRFDRLGVQRRLEPRRPSARRGRRG